MTNASKKDTGAAKNGGTCFARNLALWAGCAFLWCAVDRLSKAYFDSNFHVGQIAAPDIFGLVQLNLVHNKGVAWGAFAGSIPIIACDFLDVYWHCRLFSILGASFLGS